MQMDIPVHKGMITTAKAIKPHPVFLSAVLLNPPVNQKTTSHSCNDANTLISHAVNLFFLFFKDYQLILTVQ